MHYLESNQFVVYAHKKIIYIPIVKQKIYCGGCQLEFTIHKKDNANRRTKLTWEPIKNYFKITCVFLSETTEPLLSKLS
jgi:hypothetical protein